jgi:hypothetical protein
VASLPVPGTALYAAARIQRIANVAACRLLSIIVGATRVKIGIPRASALPTGRSAATLLLAATCVAWSATATAAADFSAGASVSFEHDTNPIELGTNEAHVFDPDGKSDLDDTSRSWGANVGLILDGSGPLRLNLQALYSHTESARFDRLGHDDYSVGGSLAWKVSRAIDVSLTAEQFRAPIRQSEAGGDRATQRTTHHVASTVQVRPTPRWQLSVSPSWNRVDLPLESAPDFVYRETGGNVALSYVGGRISPGVMVSESRSRNSGIGGATKYRQQTIWGTLNYSVPNFSTLSLSVGRTKRTTDVIEATTDPDLQQAEGADSGISGSLGYQRRLSVKTSVNINGYRNFQQYDAGVNLSVNTGFSVGVNWSPTERISVAVENNNSWSTVDELPEPGAPATVPGKRKDLLRSYSVSMGYLFAKRVSVGVNVARRIRRSEVWTDQFNGTIVGLSLSAKLD